MSRTFGIAVLLPLLAVPVIFASPGPQAQPGPPRDLIAQAHQAEQKRDFPAASALYREYLKGHPDSAEVLQRLGLVNYLANRFDDAIPPLTRALQLDPSLWGSAMYLGMSDYRADRFKDAIAMLKRALELKPGIPEAEYWLGCSFLAAGDTDSAVRYLIEADADPNWALQAQSALVKAYRKAAEDSYLRIATVAPDSERVHLVKAQLLQWKGVNNGAVWESREALKRNPGLEGAHRIIGEVYWQEKGFDLAASEFEAELRVNPLDGESNLRLGEFWLAKSDPGKAEPCLKVALQQAAGSPGEAHHFLGEAAVARHDYASAIADLREAARENPSDPSNHRLLADAYRASGQPDLAAQEDQLSHSAPAPSAAPDQKAPN